MEVGPAYHFTHDPKSFSLKYYLDVYMATLFEGEAQD